MLQPLIAVLFVALLLLIMRVSTLNSQIAQFSEQLSDCATIDYVNGLVKAGDLDYDQELKHIKPHEDQHTKHNT
jgi:hypothetical protein